MRLPWKRDPKDIEARRQAERRLEEVRAQWPKVHEQAQEAVEGLKRNHIAEGLNAIFSGKP